MTESVRKNWRALCADAAIESDSDKLASLVEQILQAFDENDEKLKDKIQTPTQWV